MRLFGTDGIRGRTNSPPMTPENVLRIGMAAAKVLRKEHGRNMVIIGKDTRLSGYMIESALTSGICSMGMDVILTGRDADSVAAAAGELRNDGLQISGEVLDVGSEASVGIAFANGLLAASPCHRRPPARA